MILIFPTQLEARLFKLYSPESHVEICGVGMAACAATVARIAADFPDDMLILAGIAGTYDSEDIAVGEVVEIVEEEIEELPEMFQVKYRNLPYFSQFRTAISNTVSRSGHKAEVAQIENMEGAAFFAICQSLGVQHTQIRAISNRVGEPFAEWKINEALKALTDKLIEIVVW
ncbi:MAG: hypothetical protein SNG02_00725 [Rikenellaceae bacterium]